MSLEQQVIALTEATEQLLQAVNTRKADLDTAETNASLSAQEAQFAANQAADLLEESYEPLTMAQNIAGEAAISAGEAATSTSQALAVYGSAEALQTALQSAQNSTRLAENYAEAASSVVQQDLTGVTAAALHRSPNAITAMFVYDTSKDSDGGAWTEKCQHTSWYNEAINGKWLGAQASEAAARAAAANSFGSELIPEWSNSRVSIDQAGNPIASKQVTTVVGAQYLLKFSYEKLSAFPGANEACVYLNGVAIIDLGSVSTLTGSVSYGFVATTTTTTISIGGYSREGDEDFYIDNTSLREIINQTSGDYFQLTTDGKFYKLNDTSGITEVFRGNKRDFPRLAGIVSEAGNVTIYDLTEPGRPMWMRFAISGGGLLSNHATLVAAPNSLYAINAKLALTGSTAWRAGFQMFDFGNDSGQWWSPQTGMGATGRNIVEGLSKRQTKGLYRAIPGQVQVAEICNAVAMTVLPDAPVDPVTGLKVPTIAVATNGGVSVIQHSGVVRNSSSTIPFNSIAITPQLLSLARTADATFYWTQNPGALGASFALSTRTNAQAPDFNTGNTNGLISLTRSEMVRRSATAATVQKLKNFESTPARGIAATITNLYNTGHQPGDIRRTFLADISAETIDGTGFVTNPDFATNLNGWTTFGSVTWVSAGVVYINTGSAGNRMQQSISVTPGKRYVFKLIASFGNYSANGFFAALGNTFGGSQYGILGVVNNTSNVVRYFEFVPTQPTIYINISLGGSDQSAAIHYVGVSAGSMDRSYKGQGAFLTGNLTKSPVASNAELVAYSGFSASNYLREPYSADLDFGTGEWSVGAWVSAPPRYNILTKTEQFDDSYWTKTNATVVPNAVLAPDGTVSADKLVADATNGRHNAISAIYNGDASHGASIYFKAAGLTKCALTLSHQTFTRGVRATVDLTAGTVSMSNLGAGAGADFTCSNVGNGWYRVFLQGTVNYGTAYLFAELLDASGADTFVGDGDSGVYVWGADLRVSANIGKFPSYQRVNTATDYAGADGVIADRAFSSGPAISLGLSGGKFTATAFDGTTTRTVTTTAAYNTATWAKAEACYTTDGTLAIRVNGVEVAATRGNPLLTLNSKYNLLIYTEAWATSPWVSQYYSVIANNAGTDPLGGNTASKVTFTSNSSNVFQGVATASGASYTFSFWAKWLSGNTNLKIRHYRSATGNNTSFTPTSAWQKFTVTVLGVSGGGNVDFGVEDTNSSGFGEILVWGAQVELGSNATTYQRVSAATDFDFQAPLTIGNSYALNAPFPGSVALLKLSTTVPTQEQSVWMYEQEKQLFREGAQCCLPDSGSIVDLTYDDATDKWIAASASNISEWSGLVRTNVTPVPAGSYSKLAAASGVTLQSRTTTSPGVDITIPSYLLREELIKKSESAAKLESQIVTFDYVGGFTASTTNGNTAITSVANLTYPTSYIGARVTGSGIPSDTFIAAVSGTTIYLTKAATSTATNVQISFSDFILPVGYEAKIVMNNGAIQREGITQSYTRLFDGFKETIRFAVVPGYQAWIQIQATRSAV